MTLAVWFWLFMAFWLIFGLWWHWWASPPGAGASPLAYAPAGGTLILFVLFLLLGVQVFGSPFK